MYPEITLCEFCDTMHAGNSNNCPQPEPEDIYPFPDDPPGTEQLCWNVFNAVRDITSAVKETIDMIPQSTNRGTAAPAGGGGGGRGGFRQNGGGGGRQQRSGLPYLNVSNQHEYLFLEDQTTVKIVDCRVGDGSGSSAVVLRLAIKGKSILWGLSLNNPSLDILTDAFGRNENDWVNQSIKMWLEEDKFTEKVWIHCAAGDADATEEEEPKKDAAPARRKRS